MQTLALVMDELDRMSRIVDDLLTLAKWEQPDFLKPAAFEVGALVDDVLAKASALGLRNWQLDSFAEATIVADRQRVTQALMQLAAKHRCSTPRRRRDRARRLRRRRRDAPLGPRHGPGHPVEERGGSSTVSTGPARRERSDGAGLGLSIVQAIARAHGGRVELSSVPGTGARFTIVLPARPAEDTEGRKG